LIVLALGSLSFPAAAAEAPGEGEGDASRIVSVVGLSGAYAGLGAWTWVAWYDERRTLPVWRFGGDGGFGRGTYAGGADKLGHLWSASLLSRLSSDLLESGGWSRVASSAFGSGLCLGALTLIEVNDGFYTEFSPGDLSADVLGVAAALAFRHVPGLDEALDFRVQWFPSSEFRRKPGANFAEDYSGQTYLLAGKPRALDAVRESPGPLATVQFVDMVVGFEARGYAMKQVPEKPLQRSQVWFLGLTVDVQAILDFSLEHRGGATHRLGHDLFEYVNPPLSTAAFATLSRRAHSPMAE
jgi:hypothetical protein